MRIPTCSGAVPVLSSLAADDLRGLVMFAMASTTLTSTQDGYFVSVVENRMRLESTPRRKVRKKERKKFCLSWTCAPSRVRDVAVCALGQMSRIGNRGLVARPYRAAVASGRMTI